MSKGKDEGGRQKSKRRKGVAQRKGLTRRQTWKGNNDRWKAGGEAEHKRRWRESKKESGYGGGWRKERGTTPKARGASRAGEENEQRVHGGRLESARDDTSMKSANDGPRSWREL
jgi:hypothetical protein